MKGGNNPVVHLLRKTWEYSKGNRKNVLLYFVLFAVADSVELLSPLIVAYILNTIQTRGITSENYLTMIGLLSLFIVIEIVFWSMHGPARVIETRNAFLVRANYKKNLLAGTMALPMSWHTDHHSGDTIDKIEKGTRGLYHFAEDTFVLIDTVIRLVGSYIALVYFNLHAAYLVLFLFVITVSMILRFDQTLSARWRKLNKAENKISERVFDVLSNITTVIILRIEKLVVSSIWQRIISPLSLFVRTNKLNEVKWFFVSFATALMVFSVLASYIFTRVRAGEVVLVGTLFALYTYVDRINGLLNRVAYAYGDIVRHHTAVQNAEEISKDFALGRSGEKGRLSSEWRELKISHLNFSYHTEKGADLHLEDVSLDIDHGGRIALVGESGSGKTTLLKIIRELYTPQHIEVYRDAELLPRGFAEISEDIALIPQDPEIFATTIIENITVGVEVPLSHVKRFTDIARFTEVAERLPKQWDSLIYEKGVNLSGGEKQRLALARGLLASEDKEIILLDEATSSVDIKNELAIYEGVFSEFKEKTIIASIHRLHLLPMFDRIYFFAEGKIIASGTFEELLATSPEFKELWDKYNESRELLA